MLLKISEIAYCVWHSRPKHLSGDSYLYYHCRHTNSEVCRLKSILCRVLNCPKEFSFFISFSRQWGKGRGRQLTVSCTVCECVCACTREQRVRDRQPFSTKAQRSHLFPQQRIHKFYSQVGHRTFI